MLVHWVKVIWAKDGGSGTQWGPAIIFSEKKSTSLNPMRLSPRQYDECEANVQQIQAFYHTRGGLMKYAKTQVAKHTNTPLCKMHSLCLWGRAKPPPVTNATLVFVGFFGHHGNHADTFNNIFAVLALSESVLADGLFVSRINVWFFQERALLGSLSKT